MQNLKQMIGAETTETKILQSSFTPDSQTNRQRDTERETNLGKDFFKNIF